MSRKYHRHVGGKVAPAERQYLSKGARAKAMARSKRDLSRNREVYARFGDGGGDVCESEATDLSLPPWCGQCAPWDPCPCSVQPSEISFTDPDYVPVATKHPHL